MSVNKVILVGHLGKDPESSMTKDGTIVSKFSLATTEKWGGNEKTDWHRITAFGKLADICNQYLVKGKLVYIDGRVQYGSYEKEGRTVYTTDIIANQMQMLSSKTEQANERTTEQANDDVAF